MKAILCFGDSITFGVGEKPTKGWCGRLKDYFESKDDYNFVMNLSFPGHDSFDLFSRMDSELKTMARMKRDSDEFLVIVSIGTNDCRYEEHPDKNNVRTLIGKYKENILKIIEIVKKYPVKILFVGIPPVDEKLTMPWEEQYHYTNERVKLFNEVAEKCCKIQKVSFLNQFEFMIAKDYFSLLEDGVHPNSKGYDFMFERIKEFLILNRLIK